jgi:hypothetical protein
MRLISWTLRSGSEQLTIPRGSWLHPIPLNSKSPGKQIRLENPHEYSKCSM